MIRTRGPDQIVTSFDLKKLEMVLGELLYTWNMAPLIDVLGEFESRS